jgi:hypothetical protein
MATVTPNFNWPVPTSTDLVKDGATAIEALGDSIDASLVDLKGGTTGQVLSKTSNTDMDFTWVAADDTNAIQNTIVDAKGDLIAASAADTPARLAVGSNGETLVADSSTSTGLRWQTIVNRNNTINGAMDCWQRGTSFTSFGNTTTYVADRYYAYRSGLASGMTISRQATGDTTNLPNIQYAMRLQRDSGNTSTAGVSLLSDWESVNSIPLAGQTVTLSFYARAGANYSATSNAFSGTLTTGTGTDQALRGGYTGQTGAISLTATLTTTWQRFQLSGTLAATATQIGLAFSFTPTGTAGANDYVDLTGIQVELGNVATKFQRNGATIQGELSACQRYYIRLNAGNTGIASTFGMGYAGSTTSARIFVPLPVPMRRTGSNYLTLDYSSVRMQDDNTSYTIGTLSLPNYQDGGNGQIVLATSTGMTQYRPMELDTTNGGYIGFSAEL